MSDRMSSVESALLGQFGSDLVINATPTTPPTGYAWFMFQVLEKCEIGSITPVRADDYSANNLDGKTLTAGLMLHGLWDAVTLDIGTETTPKVIFYRARIT